MNIISIDLPWNPDKKGRRAVAVADLDGNVKIAQAGDDNELLELIRGNTESESLVLLDVPIEGCGELDSEHFRPVDKALARQGIPILPTSKAKDRGNVLKERIKSINRGKRVTVQEIYPYAIYKFLAYLKEKELLQRLGVGEFDTLLDDGFRIYRPPKYKRERKRGERRDNMKYLYSLLTDPSLGLRFLTPLPYPNDLSNPDKLSDEYDACLGAIVGVYSASNSRYACIAGNSESGDMLLLADKWLVEGLGREVRVGKPGEGV